MGLQRQGRPVAMVIMVKHSMDVTLSVPLHDPMKQGTLRKIIADVGLSVEEFCELL